MLEDGCDAHGAQRLSQRESFLALRNAATPFPTHTRPCDSAVRARSQVSDSRAVCDGAIHWRCILVAAVFLSGLAHAHGGAELTTSSLWLILLACVPFYAFGARRLWRKSGRGRGLAPWQAAAAGIGWLALIAALAPPLEKLAEVSFAAHMIQHEILMLVSAPLLVLGKPLGAFVWSMPLTQRHALSRAFRNARWRKGWRYLVSPLAAWSVHALVLWSWHAPAWFEAGLRNNAIHDLQHASFFASALLFWWALVRRRPDGIAVLYVLTTLLHTGFLGALLTFAPNVWYPTYVSTVNPWSLTPLADQQLGGLIMWIPAGAVFMFAGLLLLARWLRSLERRGRIGLPARTHIP
jgi:putative membrane protein